MRFISAGELVAVEAELSWTARLVERATGRPAPARGAGCQRPTVRLRIEASTRPFAATGLRPITRGALSDGRRTLLRDAGGSGFDLLVEVADGTGPDDPLSVTARYRPPVATRAANLALAARFGLLAGQVLVHYPVLWRAGWRGRVPLHVAAVATRDGTALLAGPGGIGKSTVLLGLLAEGAVATADNLCCADAERCFGVAEPLRVDRRPAAPRGPAGGEPVPQTAAGPPPAVPRQRAGHGRTSHGRVDRPLPHRAAELVPDRVVVLERAPGTRGVEATAVEPGEAARCLVAGTYAAGELRRYWAFAATLALATGRGPAHPPVEGVARAVAGRLPCSRVRVGDGAAVGAAELCGVRA
jgi:hypothetical protein